MFFRKKSNFVIPYRLVHHVKGLGPQIPVVRNFGSMTILDDTVTSQRSSNHTIGHNFFSICRGHFMLNSYNSSTQGASYVTLTLTFEFWPWSWLSITSVRTVFVTLCLIQLDIWIKIWPLPIPLNMSGTSKVKCKGQRQFDNWRPMVTRLYVALLCR